MAGVFACLRKWVRLQQALSVAENV